MARREIRVLVVGLKQTLTARGGGLYPNVISALEVLGAFTTQSGESLEIGLLHDSGTLAEDAPIRQIRKDLTELGISKVFARPNKQVVASTSSTPTAETLGAFASQLGDSAPAAESTGVLTGRRSLVRTCRSLGMPVLRFARSSKVDRDFGDWCEAPLAVAAHWFSTQTQDLQIALRLFLEMRHDLELVSLQPWHGKGPLSAGAKAWQPLKNQRLGALTGVHVQLPVQVRIDVDGPPRATIIRPDADTLAEVEHFVQTLQQQGSIQEAPSRARLLSSVTHVVEKDPSGRRLLTRRRFSS